MEWQFDDYVQAAGRETVSLEGWTAYYQQTHGIEVDSGGVVQEVVRDIFSAIKAGNAAQQSEAHEEAQIRCAWQGLYQK